MLQLSALILTDFTHLEGKENGLLFLPLSQFEPEMVFSSKLVHTFLEAIQFLWKKLSSENPLLCSLETHIYWILVPLPLTHWDKKDCDKKRK